MYEYVSLCGRVKDREVPSLWTAWIVWEPVEFSLPWLEPSLLLPAGRLSACLPAGEPAPEARVEASVTSYHCPATMLRVYFGLLAFVLAQIATAVGHLT